MRTDVAEDTIFPPQGMIAVRLSSTRMVYREAAVELVSHLLKELKKTFFDERLVARVYGVHFLFELLQFPCSIPEFRVKGGNTQSFENFLSDLYPCAGGGLRRVWVSWLGWNGTSVKDRGHSGIHELDMGVYVEISYRDVQVGGGERTLFLEIRRCSCSLGHITPAPFQLK